MMCRILMDKVYDSIGEGPLPFLFRLKLKVHSFFCQDCEKKLKELENVQEILETAYFPEDPKLEDLIMEQVYLEEIELTDLNSDSATGVSFHGWVITGLIILVSLSTSFFSMDFVNIAASHGLSFLLPIGLTIGGIVTGYGALFIASHLKELSDRFRLH